MKTQLKFRFLLPVAITSGACLGSNQLFAQSTIPPVQTPASPNTQTPAPPGSPVVPGTYDPRNPSGNYSSPNINPNQAYPNNQSPAGQTDPLINQNTNPVRPNPPQPGLDPNASPIQQPTQPDVNNNKQISPNGAGSVNPAKTDTLPRKKR